MEGDCIQIDIIVEDIMDYLNPSAITFFNIKDWIRFDGGQQPQCDIDEIPNPFGDGTIDVDELLAEWATHSIILVEAAIDVDSFTDRLSEGMHLQAGVFSGKEIFNFGYWVYDLVKAILIQVGSNQTNRRCLSYKLIFLQGLNTLHQLNFLFFC